MHVRVRVGQWGSQNPQSAHMAASVASRYALGADGVGAARPRAPVAAGSLCLALRARRRRRGGAARPRAPTCALRVTAHVVSWGGECGDVEDVVRCALLERLGARRASSSCRGRGWGGTPREPQCRAAAAKLERSAGTVTHGKRAARERRRRRSKVSRRRRAGRRAVGGACACHARSNGRRRPCGGWVVVWQQLRITSGWLPLIGGSITVLLFY